LATRNFFQKSILKNTVLLKKKKTPLKKKKLETLNQLFERYKNNYTFKTKTTFLF
jgi:hypothetical protein